MKKIAIGNDHAGFDYKDQIVALLESMGFLIQNHGTDSSDSVDYPDYVHPVANAVSQGDVDLGIVMCGSGNGVSMTVNKYPSIRAALCWIPEIATLARQHNDANILSIPVRFVDESTALEMVKEFVSTDFEGGRHQRRVAKICP